MPTPKKNPPARVIARAFGKGWHAQLVKVGAGYEVVIKHTGKAAKVFRQHDAWIAKQQFSDFVRKHS